MDISLLESSVSIERLANCALRFKKTGTEEYSYLSAKKDLAEAYMLNEAISKEVRFVLAQFEVLLRNKVNEALIIHKGDDWSSGLEFFKEEERLKIEEAKRRIIDNKKEPTHVRIIAKLSFGFWTRLFNSPYSEILSPYKNIIFPRNTKKNEGRVLSMTEIRTILGSLNNIRNKVSHQEFILDQKYKIKTNYTDCVYLMRIMEKDYYSIFKDLDKFNNKFEEYRAFRNKVLEREEFKGFS